MNGADPRVDLYAKLGVKPDASDGEIKRAYRKLARSYHPDATGGDKAKEVRFKEISTAYDVLGDPKKRAEYDAMRAGPRMPPGWSAQAGDGMDGMGFDLGGILSQMFGGATPTGDVHYSVFTGDGAPFAGFTEPGARRRTGRRPARAKASERTIRASDGSPLTARGNDVHSDVRLAVDQAILGTAVDVATLTGRATVKIPPGTSSGVKLRLKGKGPDGGDHYVTVQIDVPTRVDDEARRLLVELMRRVRQP